MRRNAFIISEEEFAIEADERRLPRDRLGAVSNVERLNTEC
jgi:hypothetical protein